MLRTLTVGAQPVLPMCPRDAQQGSSGGLRELCTSASFILLYWSNGSALACELIPHCLSCTLLFSHHSISWPLIDYSSVTPKCVGGFEEQYSSKLQTICPRGQPISGDRSKWVLERFPSWGLLVFSYMSEGTYSSLSKDWAVCWVAWYSCIDSYDTRPVPFRVDSHHKVSMPWLRRDENRKERQRVVRSICI